VCINAEETILKGGTTVGLALGLRDSGCAARSVSCSLHLSVRAILQQTRACRLQVFFSPPSTPLSFTCSRILAAYFTTILCYSYIVTYIHTLVARMAVPRPSGLEGARLPATLAAHLGSLTGRGCYWSRDPFGWLRLNSYLHLTNANILSLNAAQ